jgi:hypothetical protein
MSSRRPGPRGREGGEPRRTDEEDRRLLDRAGGHGSDTGYGPTPASSMPANWSRASAGSCPDLIRIAFVLGLITATATAAGGRATQTLQVRQCGGSIIGLASPGVAYSTEEPGLRRPLSDQRHLASRIRQTLPSRAAIVEFRRPRRAAGSSHRRRGVPEASEVACGCSAPPSSLHWRSPWTDGRTCYGHTRRTSGR